MKKLLGLLSIAPIAITACTGGSDGSIINGVNVGSSGNMMDQIVSEDIDFAGTWGDARRWNGTGNNDSIVALGIEENRIANDGIQAEPNMSTADMFHTQELFKTIVTSTSTDLEVDLGSKDEDGNVELEHVLELYGHGSYTTPADTNQSLTYLDAGTPTQKKMITKTPAAGEGTIFDASGMLKGDLNITFIPSTDPTHATTASAALEAYIEANHVASGVNVDVTINVATDYNTAATALENGTIDLAFLPVGTWALEAASTQFILQAGRPAQVATVDINENGDAYQPESITNQAIATTAMNRFSQLYVEDVTTAILSGTGLDEYQTEFKKAIDTTTDELHTWALAVQAYADDAVTNSDASKLVAGSYEAFIWAKDGTEITNLIQEELTIDGYDNDWTIDVSDMDLKYGYTSTTSSSTFLFPELWLHRHLDSTLKLS